MPTDQQFWTNSGLNFVFLLVGAAISYWSTRRFDKIQQKRKDNILAYNITFTVAGILNDLLQLNNIMVRLSKTHAAELQVADVWQLIPMTFGWDQSRAFTDEQLALVASMGDADLVTRLEEAVSAHRLYTSAANRVTQLKMEFAGQNLTRRVEGPIIVSEGTPEQFAKVLPIVVTLKELADKIAYDLPNAVDDVREIASVIGPRLKKHFKFKHLTTVDVSRRDGGIVDERDSPDFAIDSDVPHSPKEK